MMIIHLCAIWSWICQGGSEITIQVKSPVLASMLVVEMAGGRNRGLYYFQNSSFFIKPDLRDLSFLTGGLMQFFFYKMQVVFFIKVRILCIYEV